MLEKWIIIISGAAFSPFLYFVVHCNNSLYNMTIQLRINKVCSNNYASAIRHNILRCGEWQEHNWIFFSNAIPNY